jgi:hypothetical protein
VPTAEGEAAAGRRPARTAARKPAGRRTTSGTAGCGWHSPVQTLRDQLRSHCGELVTQCEYTAGSHCGELTPGAATVTADVATAAAASGIDATALAMARRRRNFVMAGLQWIPVRLRACSSLCAQGTPQTTIGPRS